MADIEIATYDPEKDKDAVVRIWREVGWIESDAHADAMQYFIAEAACLVARIDGEAECAVMTTPGTIRYQESDLPLSIVSAVTTSRVGRKLGLASKLTARAVAESATEGAAVSILGMFEQGFYDKFGFGSGSYEHRIRFDPASLKVDVPYRAPVRLTVDDWQEMHNSFSRRLAQHGSTSVRSAGFTRADLLWTENPFGLGYRDESGTLTHFVWGSTKGEHGPYNVTMVSYQSTDQLLELLKLISVLGDQVRSVGLHEPYGIQLQDLVRHVVRQEITASQSDHSFRQRSGTWWQVRLLDVPAAVAARSYLGPPVRFVADLTDPIEKYADNGWSSGGRYVVTVGEESSAEPGTAEDLPVLSGSINAFSRMWFGVRPASALTVTDDLEAPDELLADLDRALAMAPPHPGMFF